MLHIMIMGIRAKKRGAFGKTRTYMKRPENRHELPYSAVQPFRHRGPHKELILKPRAAIVNKKQRPKFIEHYKLYCRLETVHFKTLNKFNTSLDLDLC